MSASRILRPALAAARRTAPQTTMRTYAAATAPNTKPPIELFGVDGTYASALVRLQSLHIEGYQGMTDGLAKRPVQMPSFIRTQCPIVLHPTPLLRLYKLYLTFPPQYTAAAKQSALDNTSRAITSLSNVMKQDTKLQSILSTPTLQESDKSAIVGELEKHTGGADKSGTVKNFLSTLAQNNRLGILEGVCEKFTQLISAGKGEIELIITSAAVSSTYNYAEAFYPTSAMIHPTITSAPCLGIVCAHTDFLRNSTTNSSNASSPPFPDPSTHKGRSSKSSRKSIRSS